MEPYSSEFRGEVLAAFDANEGTRDIAVRFKVSESWVRLIKQRRRETGQIAPKTAAPHQPKWQAWADWLVTKITARPDIYLRELQDDLKLELGEDACLMTICNACRALEQSRKKDADCQRAGSPRRRAEANGVARLPRSRSIPPKSFLSTKHGPKLRRPRIGGHRRGRDNVPVKGVRHEQEARAHRRGASAAVG